MTAPNTACVYVCVSACLRVSICVRSRVLFSDDGSVKGKVFFFCQGSLLRGGYQNTMKTSKASMEIVYVNELIKD